MMKATKDRKSRDKEAEKVAVLEGSLKIKEDYAGATETIAHDMTVKTFFERLCWKKEGKSVSLFTKPRKENSMNTMDTNMYLAEYYLARLNDLSDRTKLYILKKLADSLVNDKEAHTVTKEEKNEALRRLAGAWAGDPESDAMAEAIRTGRRSNKSRKLISFDE